MNSEDLRQIKQLLEEYKFHLVDLRRDFQLDIKITPINAKWYRNHLAKFQKYEDSINQIDNLVKTLNDVKHS